ncbi:MAG: cyclic nucleotide-binding domain-containing protein [bacterium]
MAAEIDTAVMQSFRCFRGMSPVETVAAARHLETMHLPQNQTLFRQGDPCDAMYLLRSGRIEIERSVLGREHHVLMTLEADTIFGEIGLLLDEPRTATARASTAVDLWRISRPAFESALVQGESWANKFLLATAQNLARRELEVGDQLMGLLAGIKEREAKPQQIRVAELEMLRNRLYNQWSF